MKLVERTYLVGKEEFEYDYVFPDGRIIDAKTDFEFLPEWTGPICEVVLPMLTNLNWVILPIGEKVSIIKLYPVYLNNELNNYDFSNIIFLKPFTTALVDAYIKMEKEKKQNE
ncbi:hypothetical protein [Leptospira santarosai]|uniref:hypothetical protein n=1 Tax=Leptospira santarosai TaxID=28183 RepID=UPI0039B0B01D